MRPSTFICKSGRKTHKRNPIRRATVALPRPKILRSKDFKTSKGKQSMPRAESAPTPAARKAPPAEHMSTWKRKLPNLVQSGPKSTTQDQVNWEHADHPAPIQEHAYEQRTGKRRTRPRDQVCRREPRGNDTAASKEREKEREEKRDSPSLPLYLPRICPFTTPR